jgi:hypothetical protein
MVEATHPQGQGAGPYVLSEDARSKRDERQATRRAEPRKRAERRRQEKVRQVLLWSAGFVIPHYQPSSIYINKRWPLKNPARAECEGFLRYTDPGWAEANREVSRVWVSRTWAPAAWLLRRNELTRPAIAFDPEDPYEKETRRLFKRLLLAEDIRAEAARGAEDLAAVRELLAEDRRALGRYFENLWAALRRGLEAGSDRAVGRPADRFQRALDSVEWVRTVNSELAALLDPGGPWPDRALGEVWHYLKDTVFEGYSPQFPLPEFHTWANYVRKGRKMSRK